MHDVEIQLHPRAGFDRPFDGLRTSSTGVGEKDKADIMVRHEANMARRSFAVAPIF